MTLASKPSSSTPSAPRRSPPRTLKSEDTVLSFYEPKRIKYLLEDEGYLAFRTMLRAAGMELSTSGSLEAHHGHTSTGRPLLEPEQDGLEGLMLCYPPGQVKEAAEHAEALRARFGEQVRCYEHTALNTEVGTAITQDLPQDGIKEKERLVLDHVESTEEDLLANQRNEARSEPRVARREARGGSNSEQDEQVTHVLDVALVPDSKRTLLLRHTAELTAPNHAGMTVKGSQSTFSFLESIQPGAGFQVISSAFEIRVAQKQARGFEMHESRVGHSYQTKILTPPSQKDLAGYWSRGWVTSPLPGEDGKTFRERGGKVSYDGSAVVKFAQREKGEFDNVQFILHTLVIAEREEKGNKELISLVSKSKIKPFNGEAVKRYMTLRQEDGGHNISTTT